jgi:hypothetical protein
MMQAYPGQVLIGNVGLWVNGVLGYAYQLLRNGVVFQAGNFVPGPLYTVAPSDVGSVFSLIVTATNSNGAGPVATSAGIIVVSAASGAHPWAPGSELLF